jgi:hypothetical protein
VGTLWLALTLTFEFVVGHYGFRKPWADLLADYDVRRGRIWVVVLVVTLLAPLWTARLRGVLGRRAPSGHLVAAFLGVGGGMITCS